MASSNANEKPGIEELAGMAMHSSSLVMDPRRSESPLVRLAAVGVAVRRVASSEDRQLLKPEHMSEILWRYARSQIKRRVEYRDGIEAELGRMLLHMHAGGQVTVPAMIDAAHLFAAWVPHTRTWQREDMQQHSGRVFGFAVGTLFEYLFDSCQWCGGTGKQERLPNGQTRRHRTFGSTKIKEVACRVCGGVGHGLPDITRRVEALGILHPDYKVQGWAVQFTRGRAWLVRISGRLRRPLHEQLERR